jgi:hypothetical protein
MGSGWPQSAHRKTRWRSPLVSKDCIRLWHFGQIGEED